ncbi:hypothetical protein WKH44_16015 [Pantoea agglomerans]|uniref:hypothetical protein n=1 Tax=Enterobacter agglomerans TaxID=549 RepID=UPI003C7DA57A
MATIIDALVVTLGLDATGFKKGQKDVKGGLDDTRKQSEQTAKDMEAAGKRAASFFGSIRTELLALVGVTLSVQGFKNFITGMTDNLQQLAVNSQSLDMSAKSLDGWQRAAEAADSSAEKITGTLSGFQNLLTQIRTGGGQDNPLFAALSSFAGATGANFDYQNDNSEEVMRKIADNWGKLSKDAQRRFGGMFNFDNQTQQALTNGNLVTDADRFTKMSHATEDATRKAQEFNRRLAEMKQNFSAASQVLYEALIPYVEKLIPLIEKVGIWITEHGPEIQKFFSDTSKEISQVVDSVGGWQNALEILAAFVAGSWALKMLSGISKVRGGFGPLLAAIAAVSAWDKLKSNEDEAKKEGKSTGQYLVDKMNNNTGSTDGIMGKADAWLKKSYAWWDSISKTGDADNKYDAYGTKPRGIRNNNPGNLNFAGQAGATKEGGENGRFAVFESMRDGISALYKQIQLYFSRGVNTIESVVNKYAPAEDNNNVQAYIKQLVGATGKQADEKLSGEDTETVFKLIRGIINHENGKGYVSDQDIISGIQVGSKATAMRQQTMQQQPSAKTEIHIGEMSVQSSATSVNALGQDVQRNVSRNSLLVPSMSGQG